MAILENFLTEKEKMKKKKLNLFLEGMAKLFYFMTFIHDFHILATRCQKRLILTIFVHISAFLEDFLTELEKMNKMKKLGLVDTFFKCHLCFFIFSKERLQNVKKLTTKLTKKVAEKPQK